MIDRLRRWIKAWIVMRNADRQRQYNAQHIKESEKTLTDLSRRVYVRAQIRSMYHPHLPTRE